MRSVFTRWRYERKLSLSRGGDGLPELTSEDWSFIQRTLDATEHLIFSVSVESRVRGSAIDRAVQWPRREKGEARKRLTVDQSVVDTHRTAIDPITTVVSPLVVLLLEALRADLASLRVVLHLPAHPCRQDGQRCKFSSLLASSIPLTLHVIRAGPRPLRARLRRRVLRPSGASHGPSTPRRRRQGALSSSLTLVAAHKAHPSSFS